MRKTRKSNGELDFAPTIKLEVRIESELVDMGDAKSALTGLTFHPWFGSVKLRGITASYFHRGKRKGAEWELTKQIWRREHCYISEHICSMIADDIRQLLFETRYAGREDIDYESLFHTSADLRKYDEVIEKVEKQGGAINPFDSPIQERVAKMAQAMRSRVLGVAWLNLGSDQQFYFTKLGIEKTFKLYRERMKIWQRVRKFYNQHKRNPDWRKDAREKFGPLRDDLLDAVSERRGGKAVWKPSQIAIVDAARLGGIIGTDQWFGKPKVNQWQTLKREIDRGEELLRVAKRLGLKW